MHDDQWEGQHWNVLARQPLQRAAAREDRAGRPRPSSSSADQQIPPVEIPADTAWVKRFKFQSPMLTKFWGRPIYLGATVLLPRDYDASDASSYPILYRRATSRSAPPLGFDEADELHKAWMRDDFPRMIVVTLPASESLLRRLLRRELGQRRSLRRRDHAGADSRDREALSRHRRAVGAHHRRRIDGRLDLARRCRSSIRTSSAASGPTVPTR